MRKVMCLSVARADTSSLHFLIEVILNNPFSNNSEHIPILKHI